MRYMAIFDTVNCSASVRLHMPAHSSGASHAVTKTVQKLRRTLLRRKDKQDMHALAQPVSSITATSTADQIAPAKEMDTPVKFRGARD